MRALSDREVCAVWERGQDQGDVDRALTMLAAARPDQPAEHIAGWPLGRRDGELLELRKTLYGGTLRGADACPACGEECEFVLDLETFPARGPGTGDGPESGSENGAVQELTAGSLRLRFRLPTSRDLARAARSATVEAGRRALVGDCLLAVESDGRPVDCAEPDDELIGLLSGGIAERDPLVETLLDLSCPACGRDWQCLFDIASSLWAEIAAHARALLGEVCVLARAYGWSEGDILGMSTFRRRWYLEALGE